MSVERKVGGIKSVLKPVETLCPTALFRPLLAEEYSLKFDYLVANKDQVKSKRISQTANLFRKLNRAKLTQTFLLCYLCRHIFLGDKLLSCAMGCWSGVKKEF